MCGSRKLSLLVCLLAAARCAAWASSPRDDVQDTTLLEDTTPFEERLALPFEGADLIAAAGSENPLLLGPLQLPLLAQQLAVFAADNNPSADDWLTRWLASLNISLPDVSTKIAGIDTSITSMSCSSFQIGSISTKQTGAGEVTIKASGLQASCQLDWSVPKFSEKATHVEAKVQDGEMGSPILISTESTPLVLPTGMKAYDCSKNTKFSSITVHLEGAGVLSFLINKVLVPLLSGIIADEVCKALDNLVNTKGSEALQNLSREVHSLMMASPTTELPTLPEPRKDFIDLAANPAMKLIHKLTAQVLGNSSSEYSLNALTSKILDPDGSFALGNFVKLPVSYTINLPKLGVIHASLEALKVTGLDKWTSFLFEAPTPQNLSFNVSLQGLTANVSLKLQIVPDPHGIINGSTLEETFDLFTKLGPLGTSGEALVAINGSALKPYSFDQLPQAGCFAPSVFATILHEMGLQLQPLALSLQPTPNMGSLEHDVDVMIDTVVSMLLGLFNETIAAVVDQFVAVNVTDMLNELVHNETAAGAEKTCPPPINIYTAEGLSGVAGILADALLVMGVLALLVAYFRYSRRKGKLRAQSARDVCRRPPGEEVGIRPAEAATQAPTSPEVSRSTSGGPGSSRPSSGSLHPPAAERPKWDCLANHNSVSGFMRWSLPLLIVGDILLFVESNTSVGTSVNLSLTVNGEEVAQLPYLKGFTLVGSVRDMWDGKVYPLAIVIAFFSGFWPYIKLLAMLFCWFLPTKRLSVARRHTVLFLLDALGKWSLVDGFVMVLFMVAFQFDLSVANQAPEVVKNIFNEVGSSARLLIYVNPLWSFHVFLLATIGSIVLSHMMSMVHRRAYKIAEFGITADSALAVSGRKRLCDAKKPLGLHAGRTWAYGPLGALLGSLLLVLVGVSVETFQFKFLGLAGFALGKEGAVRPFSVVSLAMEVPSANVDPGTFQLIWIQFVFIIFSMAMVIAYNVTLIVLWCVPLSNRMHRHGLIAAQVMNAWCGLDVFCISILACILQIRQFALFIVGDKCDALDALIARIPSIASQIPDKVTCFDVEATLRPGFYLLLLSVIVSTVTGYIVLGRCSAALGVNHATPPASCRSSEVAAPAPAAGSRE